MRRVRAPIFRRYGAGRGETGGGRCRQERRPSASGFIRVKMRLFAEKVKNEEAFRILHVEIIFYDS